MAKKTTPNGKAPQLELRTVRLGLRTKPSIYRELVKRAKKTKKRQKGTKVGESYGVAAAVEEALLLAIRIWNSEVS